jgi:UDP-N-acetylmuramoyl-tripeptide--D-alanyl-D-alanine ligase
MEAAMMRLAEAGAAIGAACRGEDVRFSGVSTDTRSIAPGDLFVAIRGERYDGHEFLQVARDRGAAAAMVDARFAALGGATAPLPLLVVEETRRGLGRLGRSWRERFAPVVIAIAGSNGKTTTKEMLAAILRAQAGEAGALATHGNLNTDIGVPMTLLRLRAAHRYCAVELGMNHPGEIGQLAALALPDVAVVTNAQREHMEFMQTVEATAEENSAAIRALPEAGVAVVNADDACREVFLHAAGARRVVQFGLQGRPEVTGGYALRHLASDIVVRTPEGETAATLSIPGLHNVHNALAAAACAHAAGIPLAAIGGGLSAFRPYSGRLQVKTGPGGATLIDDSYNANPDSVRAAIDVLAAASGPTVLVLGDMGEVGTQGPAFHEEVGRYARERGVGALYALGEATPGAVSAFGRGARHFGDVDALVAAAREAALGGASLLVKGSRFMRMERVVAALAEPRQLAPASGRPEAAH